ncbi:MAG TPA: response regulator transcription factor [Burkholderiales bacterium]|nr:response regulator transcription factor [Burkholderiales bacterium]
MSREPQHARSPIRVFIVDDQLSVLWGLERLVGGRNTKMTVVGTATSGARAAEQVTAAKPDVILLDINLGSESGLDAIPALLAQSQARIVAMAGTRNPSMRDQAVLAGARGVVGKEEPPENILKAIEKVHAGELWLDRSTTGRIFVELSRRVKGGAESDEQRRIATLTAREKQIVRLLMSDHETSITALAKKIHTSEHTLRNHLTSIYNKLGVKNRLQLHVFANKHRLG